jgi:hypothetical protein
MQKMTAIMPQGETLKLQEDGIKKVGEQKAVSIQKYRLQPAENVQ